MRENTAVVEVRCDLRVLADLAIYQAKEGQQPRSKSELVRSSLELLHAALVYNESITPVDSTEQALEILESMGCVGATNKLKVRVAKAIARETQEEIGNSLTDAIARAREAHKERR